MKCGCRIIERKSSQYRSSIFYCPTHSSAPALEQALKNLLKRLTYLTTDEFAQGGERLEREAARRVLAAIDRKKQA